MLNTDHFVAQNFFQQFNNRVSDLTDFRPFIVLLLSSLIYCFRIINHWMVNVRIPLKNGFSLHKHTLSFTFPNKFRKCFWECLEQTCEIFKCVPKVFIRGFFKECISEYWKPPKNVQIARNTLSNNNSKFNQVFSHETKHFARIHGSWSIFTLPNYDEKKN